MTIQIILTAVWMAITGAASMANQTGTVERNLTEQVVGGNVLNSVIPFMVGLRQNAEGDNFCGGAFIHERLVLTAAHCVESRFSKAKFASIGSLDTSGKAGEIIEIESKISHPEYANDTNVDIAIVKLKHAPKKVKITTVRLPSREMDTMDLTGTKVKTFGWGFVRSHLYDVDRYFPTSKLKQMKTRIISNEECTQKTEDKSLVANQKSFLCTFRGKINEVRKIAKGTSDGDSGGPLIIDPLLGTPTIIGITSRGDYDWGNSPSIYTKVSYALTFIVEELKKVGVRNL